MIIGILGFSQAGKDTTANILVKQGAQKIAFADELKRTLHQIFDFSCEQLWGTIEQKEAPDLRYPRERHTWDERAQKCLCCGAAFTWKADEVVQCFLTPRYAMKIVGTEGARHCWNDIWVKRALDYAKRIEAGCRYNQQCGIESGTVTGTTKRSAVFIDCRFVNEVEGILKAGGKVYRIKRKGYEKPMYDHSSETEQLQIPDDRLTGVIMNDGTLEDLHHTILATVRFS